MLLFCLVNAVFTLCIFVFYMPYINLISSKTLECKKIPGLYFGGECLDVTGWLGGYNFQWAWASGFVIAQNL